MMGVMEQGRHANTHVGSPEIGPLWQDVISGLPDRHHVFITGPYSDGHVNVLVINNQGRPRVVLRAQGFDIAACLREVRDELPNYVAKGLHTSRTYELPKVRRLRGTKGQFIPSKPTPSESDRSPGFTRDRDLVAYLFFKNGRVTQYELRNQYHIKNPAQAINDAEEHHKFTVRTGEALPNGDIPYTLVGAVHPVDGMLPMFVEGVEDPDERTYVMELDLYNCTSCGRHPVYRPVADESGAYAGVCPRHGPARFGRI